jgi:hypothetical protein
MLKVGTKEIIDNRDKAKVFYEIFFPRIVDAKDEIVLALVEELE